MSVICKNFLLYFYNKAVIRTSSFLTTETSKQTLTDMDKYLCNIPSQQQYMSAVKVI